MPKSRIQRCCEAQTAPISHSDALDKFGRALCSGGRVGFFCVLMQLAFDMNASEVTFADVSPILASRCVMCHSGPAAPLQLSLDTLDGVLGGSRNGPVVKAGDPAGSELVLRLKGASLPRMPMTGPPFLSEDEITLFEAWIAGGLLPDPGGGDGVTAEAGVTANRTEGDGLSTYGQVAVIFATRCAKCHTENGLMGPAPEGFRLTSYAATVSAADRARIVPGNPQASELVRRIRGQARPRMPFDGPPYLTEAEILSIEEWVTDGARDSAGVPAPVPVGRRLRLHGQLEKHWRLDGLPLTIAPSTRMDKDPSPGDYVRVRGTLGKDGTIAVERLTKR